MGQSSSGWEGVTSEPLCEIKFLNLWKSLWLHHLSGRMSLDSFDMVILPPDRTMEIVPKLLNVVLYEYLTYFLTRPVKKFTLKT